MILHTLRRVIICDRPQNRPVLFCNGERAFLNIQKEIKTESDYANNITQDKNNQSWHSTSSPDYKSASVA